MKAPSAIDKSLGPSPISPGPVSISEHASTGSPTEHYSQVLMMHWHQELALRTAQLSASSSLQEQDGRRYTVLMAACRHQDVFYVKVHELCCLWSIDKTAVYQVFDSLATPEAIDFTFGELQRILNNEDLSPYNLRWFASFPWPASRMFTSFPERILAVRIARFMGKFTAFWQSLLDASEVSNRPIAGVVLKDSLHCSSPVLRYILFVTSCLQIGIISGSDAAALDDEFDESEGEGGSIRGETIRQALAVEHASFAGRQPSS
ncbi:hypothetical protein NM208_g5006 [Fusarium decemcellulare]|uniref:Uncharacterized protein n=1 Tax=Fusarium decemcellulare TaxID=57161 RepID=A0ACC1SIG6_9HYPO|nr:hypothetical protein NM208_g5006 [Fusarium decemcellulare]